MIETPRRIRKVFAWIAPNRNTKWNCTIDGVEVHDFMVGDPKFSFYQTTTERASISFPDGTDRLTLNAFSDISFGPSNVEAMRFTGGSSPAIRIIGVAAGSPSIRFYQTTTQKASIIYQDTGDILEFDTAGATEFTGPEC